MMINFKNLDKLKAFCELKTIEKKNLKSINVREIQEKNIEIAEGVFFNYAMKGLNEAKINKLQELAREADLIKKYKALLNGEIFNTSEERRVLHHLLRGQLGEDVLENTVNLRSLFKEELNKVFKFAEKIHSGLIKSPSGGNFEHIVQVGIGGSLLGPQALYNGVKLYAKKYKLNLMQASFISNVDPDEASSVLSNINLENTLFIIVSKSGKTQETASNMHLIIKKLKERGIKDYKKQMVLISTKNSILEKEGGFLEYFHMHNSIGGRFSTSSVVGMALISLSFTKKISIEILRGMHSADKNALNENIKENAPLMDALIGVYERNILFYESTAILPYSHPLESFLLHLQQLDMESNGKSVNRFGESLNYESGPIVWGGVGTNAQHSFYQLLHQGTKRVPLQFIVFKESQSKEDVIYEKTSSYQKLKANLIAQIIAFYKGRKNSNLNKNFEGERPSSLIYSQELSPFSLGAILSHYENKIMFQGFLWNINSFDQEGVQLGKVLTDMILNNEERDELIQEFEKLLM